MGGIRDDYIIAARAKKPAAGRVWIRLGAVAAALCLVVGIGLLGDVINGGGIFGNGDATVYAVHRDDFTPGIDSAVLTQFDDPSEVKKAYLMRTNEWFLSDKLTDFSQAVTTDVIYIAPGGENTSDLAKAFSTYGVHEDGTIQWGCTVYSPRDAEMPFEFCGLSYDVIDRALTGIEHEDYIIAYAPMMSMVYIWARGGAEDTLIVYLTRPDLLGLENGGCYTLGEVCSALTNAYYGCDDDDVHENEHSSIETHSSGNEADDHQTHHQNAQQQSERNDTHHNGHH